MRVAISLMSKIEMRTIVLVITMYDNMRVAISLISKIEMGTIVFRDVRFSNFYHRFEDVKCSCNNYV